MTSHMDTNHSGHYVPSTRQIAEPFESPPPPREGASMTDLSTHVSNKRSEIESKIVDTLRRRRRLLTTNIAAGSCSVALTSAPAVGGKGLADWLSSTLDLTSPVWQVMCALAAILSLVATVAAQMLKSHRLDDYLSKAQGVRLQLELLQVSLVAGSLSRDQATEWLVRCVQESASL
jgi:MFS family permease